jgi:hypothetical protein
MLVDRARAAVRAPRRRELGTNGGRADLDHVAEIVSDDGPKAAEELAQFFPPADHGASVARKASGGRLALLQAPSEL